MTTRNYRRSPTSIPLNDERAILKYFESLAKRLKRKTLTREDVNQDGRISVSALNKRFGGVSLLLVKAGLRPTRIYKRDPKLMLKLLHALIAKRGRYPSQAEVTGSLPFNAYQYKTEFGSFERACRLAKSFHSFVSVPKPLAALMREIRKS